MNKCVTVEGLYYDYNGIWKIVLTTGNTKRPNLKPTDSVTLSYGKTEDFRDG